MYEKDEKNEEFSVHVPGQYYQLLLAEIARSRGLDVGLNPKSKCKVYLTCSDEERQSLMSAAAPAMKLLQARILESISEVAQSVGETPSKSLLALINNARTLAGLSKQQNGNTHPRICLN